MWPSGKAQDFDSCIVGSIPATPAVSCKKPSRGDTVSTNSYKLENLKKILYNIYIINEL